VISASSSSASALMRVNTIRASIVSLRAQCAAIPVTV
jgi:hypothetical protein